jgi:hypothetical protein
MEERFMLVTKRQFLKISASTVAGGGMTGRTLAVRALKPVVEVESSLGEHVNPARGLAQTGLASSEENGCMSNWLKNDHMKIKV